MLGRGIEALGAAAEQAGHLLVGDLDDLLAGAQALEQVCVEGAFADAADQIAGDLEVDVGLEEGHADLPESSVDVLLGQPALVAEPAEDPVQLFSEGFEHGL